MHTRLWILAFCVLSLSHAQNVTSSLNGVLVDPAGSAVPGASCTLTNLEGGTSLKAISEASGLFTFPAVAAGAYSLEVKATGFKSLSLTGIVVIATPCAT